MNQKIKLILPYLGAVAVIIAVSLAFFWPDAVDGNVLRQHDMQQGAANSHELVQYEAETGQKAWWTNALFSGMPAFQISPAYGSTALFAWLNTLYGMFLPVPSNFLCMMMLGMFILLLSLRCKPGLALIGALAWGLSSYFVILIGAGHLWKFITLAYVPPTLAGLLLIYRGRRWLGAALAALFMMLQLNANHVQMSYYFAWLMAGLVIAYGVVAIREKKLKQWGVNTAILAGAMLLAVAANAPNLYNTYEYSKETMRGKHSELTQLDQVQASSGLDRDYIVMYSYEKGETFTLLIPNIKGGASAKPLQGGMVGTSLADSDEARQLMRQDPQMTLLQLFSPYFGGAEGTNGPVYVGAIIVALFILGCIIVPGPIKWTLLVMTLLSILLAWGRNFMWFTDLFIDWMPMYSKFRTVESILVIAQLCMPLLAILALRQIFTGEQALQNSHTPTTVGTLGSSVLSSHKSRSNDTQTSTLRTLEPSVPTKEGVSKPLLWSFGVCIFFCLLGILWPTIFGTAIMGEKDQQTIAQYIAYGALPQDFRITDYPAVLQAAEQMRLGLVKADALRSLCFLAVGLLALWFYQSRAGLQACDPKSKTCDSITSRQAWAIAIIGLAVLSDLYSADKRYLNHDSFVAQAATGEPFVATPADQMILQDPDPHYRVLDVNRFNDAAPSYFHKSVGGYHAAKLTRYQDLIDEHLRYVARPDIAQIMSIRTDTVAEQYDPADVAWLRSHLNALDMLNAKYIITDPNAAPLLNETALGNAWFIDDITYVEGADAEMEAFEDIIDPRSQAVADRKFESILGQSAPASPGDTIALTTYAPDRLEYDFKLGSDRVAVLSEVYFPWGWKAEVDGQEVEIGRVNYLLRAVNLPAGAHKLTLTFAPQSVRTTDTIATIAICLIYLLLAAGIFLSCFRPKES